MPAAAVIPALIVYTKIAAVKKLVVGFWGWFFISDILCARGVFFRLVLCIGGSLGIRIVPAAVFRGVGFFFPGFGPGPVFLAVVEPNVFFLWLWVKL